MRLLRVLLLAGQTKFADRFGATFRHAECLRTGSDRAQRAGPQWHWRHTGKHRVEGRGVNETVDKALSDHAVVAKRSKRACRRGGLL